MTHTKRSRSLTSLVCILCTHLNSACKLLECCAFFASCVAFHFIPLFWIRKNVCPHGVKAPQQPHHMLYDAIDFNLFRRRDGGREGVCWACLYTVHTLCATSECQSYRFMFIPWKLSVVFRTPSWTEAHFSSSEFSLRYLLHAIWIQTVNLCVWRKK